MYRTVPPMVWVPQQLVGVPLGNTVTIECWLEAFPAALHYWAKPDGQVLHDPSKYRIESINGASAHHLNNNSRASYTVSSNNGFHDKKSTSIILRPIHRRIAKKTCTIRRTRDWRPGAVPRNSGSEPIIIHDPFEINYSPHERQRLRTVSSGSSRYCIMSLTYLNSVLCVLYRYRCVAKNPRGETDGTIKIYRESSIIDAIFQLAATLFGPLFKRIRLIENR